MDLLIEMIHKSYCKINANDKVTTTHSDSQQIHNLIQHHIFIQFELLLQTVPFQLKNNLIYQISATSERAIELTDGVSFELLDATS